MEKIREVSGHLWRRYRGSPLWFQVAIGVVVLSVIVGPFLEEDDEEAAWNEQASPSTTAPAPTTTQKVYLATALACSRLADDSARFAPLEVSGPSGYKVTVEPVDDCREQKIFNSYVYDVPMPASGEVKITPGNQPPATIEAAKATASGAVTVYYARKGEGQYEVTVTEYDKAENVKDAP